MISTVKTVNTSLPPCCMVHVDNYLVIGTYKLEDTCRDGTLDVYTTSLELVNTVPTKSAILDIALHEGIIYCAHSTGFVSTWKLKGTELVHVADIPLSEESNLVLQLDFKDNKMASTLTDGSVVLYDLMAQKKEWEVKSHDLEPWCVRFGNNGLWTGGDDQALCFHDLNEGTRVLKLKYHDAGVTSILPVSENALWTGGYDDRLRILDLRTRRSNENINLEGGVWRLLPNPEKEEQILTCCMYNGVTLLEKTHDLELPKVTAAQPDLHQSMVYGGAWVGNKGYTCSFYDCLVQAFTV